MMNKTSSLLSKAPLYQARPPVEWHTATGLVPYENALTFMEARVEAILARQARELIWLVEHPPLFTAGTSARETDLLTPKRFPVYKAGRGGQYTYHGPGQRVVYVMLDLNRRQKDVRVFIAQLENWLIDTLTLCGVQGETREDRVGIWVRSPPPRSETLPDALLPGPAHQPENEQEDKIAAIGVRLRKWVSWHGMAINIDPDLEHFSGIVPCGIRQYGVTSLQALGKNVTMAQFDAFLKESFVRRFGPVEAA